MERLSSNAENLSDEAKLRYQQKISVINGLDLFRGCVGVPVEAAPTVDSSDLVSNLVLQTDFITAKQFKAHRSLEAYNQFVYRLGQKCTNMESSREICHHWTSE